ncbi:hypothetical protein PR202_gb00650 [Eleusine coracana subsp. coracana]|uniref:Uncharacterized protein n=1 Tax=Eleusine coracana subsp. coracana TaxID=191504 RepID=A0AAV5DUG4_ELECO|nr:hypothetical protein PR202_gb00650 [Eleusine coracana subsp. coracana]
MGHGGPEVGLNVLFLPKIRRQFSGSLPAENGHSSQLPIADGHNSDSTLDQPVAMKFEAQLKRRIHHSIKSKNRSIGCMLTEASKFDGKPNELLTEE